MPQGIITSSQVPVNYCYTNIQADWPRLVKLLSVEFSGAQTTINYGSDTPSPEDRDKPWLKLNADGTPDKRYEYYNGVWIALHPMAPGIITMYEGSEASIETFDGGEAGSVTSVSGPMWEKVTEINGRFPIGPGTTPDGTVVSIAGTGGSDAYSLNIARENLPSQPLYVGVEGSTAINETDDNLKPLGYLRTGGGVEVDYTQATTLRTKVARTSDLGDGEALEFTQLPPYYAMWFIRRTARLYYRN